MIILIYDEVGDHTAMQSAEISESPLSPSVRRLINEHELSAENIIGTGKDGRITKQDVLAVIKAGGAAAQSTPVAKQTSAAPVQPKTEPASAGSSLLPASIVSVI